MSVNRFVLPTAGLIGVGVGIGVGGFLVPPRATTRDTIQTAGSEEKLELPDALPDGFVRYAHTVFGDPIPAFDTAVIRGRARMRPISGGPWLHARMTTNHLLGRAFAAEFSVTWFGMPTLRAADAYLDGRGIVERSGWRPHAAPELDQSAAMFMWLEAGMFPQSWRTPGLTFRQVDEVTLELGIPGLDDPITWRMDPVTWAPREVSAPRYREVGGPKIVWRAELGPFRDYGPMRWWSSASAIWDDQGTPWLAWAVDEVRPGAPVTETLERHRAQPPQA